jgi:hypothetical protein
MMAKERAFEDGGAIEPEERVPMAKGSRLFPGQARIEI